MKIYLKYAVYFILALPISAGCVEESLETDGGSEIILSAGLQGSVLSKAPAEGIYPDTDDSYPVSLLRWDQDDNLSWSDREFLHGDLGVPEASSDGLRRPIDFDKPQYFKSRDLPAGFIGIYPEADTGRWKEQSAGKYITSDDKMTYEIDGYTARPVGKSSGCVYREPSRASDSDSSGDCLGLFPGLLVRRTVHDRGRDRSQPFRFL